MTEDQENIVKGKKPGSSTLKKGTTKKMIRNSAISTSDDLTPQEKPQRRKKKNGGGASFLFILLFLGAIGGGVYHFRDTLKEAMKPKVVKKPSPEIKPQAIQYVVKKKEVVKDEIKKLSDGDLKRLRAKLQPKDLDLYSLDEKVQLYINQFEGKEQELEEQRLEWASSFRSEIIYLLQQEPFYGYVFLKDGGPVGGWISVGENEELFLKTKKKVRSLAWNDLQFKQWQEIIVYFASKEANNFRLDGVNKNSFLAISDLYKKLALFYHWYNLNDQAEQLFDKARLLNPELSVLNDYIATVHSYEIEEKKAEDDIVYMKKGDSSSEDKLKDVEL